MGGAASARPSQPYKPAHYPQQDQHKDHFQRVYEGHRDSVTTVVVSGKYLFSASRDTYVKRWNLKNTAKRRECSVTYRGHTFWVECMQVVDNYLFTGSADHTIKAWNVKTAECLQTYKGHTNDVTNISVKGKYLFSTSRDNTMKVWDIEKGEVLREYLGHSGWVEQFVLSAGTAFTGSHDKTVRAWDVESGECTRVYDGHMHRIQCMEVDPVTNILYTGSADEVIISWAIMGHQLEITHISIHNGNMYSSSRDCTLRQWNTTTNEMTKIYRGHTAPIKTFIISQNHMFSASADHNEQTGECVKTMRGHTNPVTSLAIYRRLLLTGSDDKRVLGWKIPLPKEPRNSLSLQADSPRKSSSDQNDDSDSESHEPYTSPTNISRPEFNTPEIEEPPAPSNENVIPPGSLDYDRDDHGMEDRADERVSHLVMDAEGERFKNDSKFSDMRATQTSRTSESSKEEYICDVDMSVIFSATNGLVQLTREGVTPLRTLKVLYAPVVPAFDNSTSRR
ncbi:putative protein-like [Planoprotostelium fungivorum]|uniref:Uncharacterized protein n=1 Tax=Planoprotostelium fungivorum TaxID=1890364 RepID=A0A2P6NCD7_9EUKA|nr:putative protein-like [Planoprotostelium fungivorum]